MVLTYQFWVRARTGIFSHLRCYTSPKVYLPHQRMPHLTRTRGLLPSLEGPLSRGLGGPKPPSWDNIRKKNFTEVLGRNNYTNLIKRQLTRGIFSTKLGINRDGSYCFLSGINRCEGLHHSVLYVRAHVRVELWKTLCCFLPFILSDFFFLPT